MSEIHIGNVVSVGRGPKRYRSVVMKINRDNGTADLAEDGRLIDHRQVPLSHLEMIGQEKSPPVQKPIIRCDLCETNGAAYRLAMTSLSDELLDRVFVCKSCLRAEIILGELLQTGKEV